MRVALTAACKVMVAMAAASVAAVAPAFAQALSPMRGEVKSFTDHFAIRVYPANPYPHRIKVEVNVYDENFAPVAARITPQASMLAPDDNRSVMVLVPFDGRTERKIRICAESVPFENAATQLRTQVCGRFLARRVR
jgi:hypothetical protein